MLLTHPLGGGGTASNRPTLMRTWNETSLEDALINVSTLVDDRNLTIALTRQKAYYSTSITICC